MLQLETTDQDGLLKLIMKNTTKALRFKLGLSSGKEFPQELDYIVLEVCVRRYNRLKNEGMASYSQEGESITFKSDDFDDFLSESINLRWGAKTDSDLIATLNPGDVVKYDAFSKHDGYV
ncbi:phage head-tail connector protein [Ligilactobacillus salivarius]|uniref:phage head-tail connector protein n=1 Tax=Ligilactobacillus salivarius TaxID=1624 RepID=UPI001F5D979C